MSSTCEGGTKLIAVIGDEDTVAGFLLAGTGEKSVRTQNFFAVTSKTLRSQIERKFEEFIVRKDIAIILINQHVSEEIRHLLESHSDTVPTVLEIPSKDHPYDARVDPVMKRIAPMLGKI